MIVRDEAETIATALRSCRELIDYWVICDTGSTDGTQALIRQELAGVPGELHEDAWINFGHNRTLLMERARGRSEYLLLLDADETVELRPGGLDRLVLDAYTVARSGEALERVTRIVRGALPWHYVGAVCEYVASPLQRTSGHLDGLLIRSTPPGERQFRRLATDRALLEAAVSADPSDARSLFHLARTLHAIAQRADDRELLGSALAAFERRATMGGPDEEVYHSLFQAGTIYERLTDWPSAFAHYIRAWEMRPSHMESVHAAAAGLLARHLPHAAARFTVLAEDPLAIPDDPASVTPWIYEWGLLMLHSVATLRSGQLDASLAASRRLLSLPTLPESRRKAARQNLSAALHRQVEVTVGATPLDVHRAS